MANDKIQEALNAVINDKKDRRECVVPGARVVEWGDDKDKQPKTYEVNGVRMSRHQYRQLVSRLREDGVIE